MYLYWCSVFRGLYDSAEHVLAFLPSCRRIRRHEKELRSERDCEGRLRATGVIIVTDTGPEASGTVKVPRQEESGETSSTPGDEVWKYRSAGSVGVKGGGNVLLGKTHRKKRREKGD